MHFAEPDDDPNVRGDAFKTLFVARLSYDTKEKDLEREFGRFGVIERVCQMTVHSGNDTDQHLQIRIVKDEPGPQENGIATGKSKKKKPHRGYAFIVYEREKDMKGKAAPSPHLKVLW